MKKALLFITIAALFAVAGAAFAASQDIVSVTAKGTTGTKATVDHQLVVKLPTVLAMIVQGTGGSTDVTFTIGATQYYNNIGTSIAPDATGFTGLKAFTNNPTGASIAVSAAATGTAPSGSANVLSAVQLNGSSINGTPAISVSAGPPSVVVTRGNFGLVLTGNEAPGTYNYTVTYTMTANP